MSFIGTQELILILVVALVVVGPKRLPDLAKNLGKGIRNFKSATAKMRSELDESGAMDEINELKASVRGLRDDVTRQSQEFTVDATSAPKPDSDATLASTAASAQLLDTMLGEPIQGAEKSKPEHTLEGK